MLTVIRGHVSFETAHEISDYPYGGYRTSIRYWLEKATKGAKKGEYRFMSCTLNPKTGVWNKPHGSIYADFMVLVQDERGYVFYRSLHGMSGGPESFASWVSEGVRHQLDAEEARQFDQLEKLSRRFSPKTWTEWDEAVKNVRAMLDEMTANLTTGSPAHLHGEYEKRHGYFYQPRFNAILNYLDALEGKYLDVPSTTRGT